MFHTCTKVGNNLKLKDMKKHIADFFTQIEENTTISLDYSTLGLTETMYYTPDDPIDIDLIVINDKMTLSVYSCGCKKCKNITGIHISYGVNSDIKDATEVKSLIKGEFPNIRIEFIDEINLFRNL